MFAMTQEELDIRKLVDAWAVSRDAGDWEQLRSVWHEGGTIQTTWFFGTGDQFVEAGKRAWANGIEVLHTLNGVSVKVRGNRAVAQTKMSIHQRARVEGILCDCVCMGRFYDLLEKRDGRWGIVTRQSIYEKDRLDPVDASEKLNLDRDKLAALPAGYRHLAYLQLKIGLDVKLDLAQTKGAEVEGLYAQGREWLEAASEA